MKLMFTRMRPEAQIPRYATDGAVGLDLFLCTEGKSVMVPKNSSKLLYTGIAISLPKGYEAQVRGRSSLSRDGLLVSLGTIDTDYRGEIRVITHNVSVFDMTLAKGSAIAQLVIQKVPRIKLVEVDELDQTERGFGGFGSTNV